MAGGGGSREQGLAIGANRIKELDGMVRRMGAVTSVFDVRSSTIGNRSYSAFRDLMDVYIEMCARELKSGHDFVSDGVRPTEEDMQRAQAAFARIFGGDAE